MSAANISQLPHLPHTAHPIPLREQAFALHCQGQRSPAIAAELGVPERTIRAWIASALDELKDDLQLSRKEQLLLAVERQHQLTASAWQQFTYEAAARSALLDAALDTLHTLLNANDPTTSANTSPRALHLRLPASTPAPRYLSLILQANKETNRLLGLHTLARLQLLAPDTPDTPDTPDLPDTDPAPLPESDIPAESATAPSTCDADFVGASTGRLSWSAPQPHIPAESATVISPPCVGAARGAASDDVGAERAESAAAGPGVGFPAKTATAAEDGLATGIQPADPHSAITSPSLGSTWLAGSPLLAGERLRL